MAQTATAARPQKAQRTPMSAPAAPPPPPVPEPVAVEPVAAESEAPARRVRQPFGTRIARLDNTPIPGFQCRWINDTPGRIETAMRGGYEHVTDADGKPVKHPVGVATTGGPLIAYRMKIPLEFFHEDKEAKEKPRRQIDADMRQGRTMKDGLVSEGRPGYIPDRIAQTAMGPDGRQTASHWKEKSE